MAAHWLLAAVVAASSMTIDGGGEDAPIPVHPGPEGTGRFEDGTFVSPHGTRRWRLWVPAGYDAARPYPLVVLLHGCTQDPDDLARGTRIASHADALGVLALLPEQPESANPKKCWNWYDTAHQARDAGEPALIAGMTRQVMDAWSVDPAGVSIAGISAGAAMATVVAIAYSDVFAAVGLHSGIPYRAARNVLEGLTVMANGAGDVASLAREARAAMGPRARTVPAIIIQGASDPVVRPVNATQSRDFWMAVNSAARGEASAGQHAADAPLARAPERGEAGGLAYTRACHRDPGQPDECEVVTILVDGLAHAWSGGSAAGTFADERGPDATREILTFLLAHPMRPAGGRTR